MVRSIPCLLVFFLWTAPVAAQIQPPCPAVVDLPSREIIAAFRDCGSERLARAYEEMLEGASRPAEPSDPVTVPTPRETAFEAVFGDDVRAGPAPRVVAPPPPAARAAESEAEIEARVAALIAPAPLVIHERGWEPPLLIDRVSETDSGTVYVTTHWYATVHDDGSVTFQDRHGTVAFGGGASTEMTGVLLNGTFDLTDIAAGLAGVDLYAGERMRFLEAIEPELARLDVAHRVGELGAALERLPQRLNAVWDRQPTDAARRDALFEEWDDCADDDWGRDARRIILAYIRRRLPADSASSYTAAEIRRLNAGRLSTERFDPYR